MREGRRVGGAELGALAAVVALAAVLRLVDLPTRGTWDADQGTDMTVLAAFVHDGVVPLLGPHTSIGDFHHGVVYYYLLAPAAFLSGADPLAVVAFVALAGIAAVAAVWWLGRSIGGPVAGLVAAGIAAVSASAIEESTFIWNPNLIALSSALALACAWRAWTTADARWWVPAAAAQTVTMHCHVLGWVLVVPLGALLVADWRRRHGPGDRRALAGAVLACVAIVALSYVPLLVSELQTGFAEARAALAFLGGGSASDAAPLPARLLIVPLRVLSWPLSGLVTSQPIAGMLAAAAVIAILGWRVVAARGGATGERGAARWFAATLAWSAVALAIAAPSLGRVVPGLPNDHYHAFLDPIVFVVVGLGAAALWRLGVVGRAATVAGIGALVALNVAIRPPAVAPDGGYPLAERAAARILAAVPDGRYRLVGLPELKRADAYGFPLRRLGGHEAAAGDAASPDLVVACDRLLEPIIGAACGGPAEDAAVARLREGATLVERFDGSPRTVISIYR